MPDRSPGTTASTLHAAPPDTFPATVPQRARRRAVDRPAPPTGLLWALAALVAVGLSGARTLRGVPLPDDGALTARTADLLRGSSEVPLLSPDGPAGRCRPADHAEQ